MRIFLDSNVIISAGLFPESSVGKALTHIVNSHELILSQYVLEEMENVFKEKFPERIEYFSKFVSELKYELIDIEIKNFEKYPKIRDMDDVPLLTCAIEAKANLFITGDKDFEEIKIETPRIINPRKYIEEFMK